MKDIDEIRRENLDAESRRLGGDIKLAAAIGKDKNQIYQWVRAPKPPQRRNISKKEARKAEVELGRAAGWLDVEHTTNDQTVIPISAPSLAVVESRSKNDMRALRFAVQSLFVVLHENMQDLAEEVAVDIVATAGTQFAKRGFLNILLGNLRGAENMSAEERLEPRPVQVSRASRRVVSVAKKT